MQKRSHHFLLYICCCCCCYGWDIYYFCCSNQSPAAVLLHRGGGTWIQGRVADHWLPNFCIDRDFPEEDENAEFYCDICEEHRYLLDPTYYCEECHFVSHVHCAIATSEEMHALVEEWSLPFKLESQKYADKQKGPALESLASVDEHEAEGSRVAENQLSIIKQDEEIEVLRDEILHLKTKLRAMDERKKELERIRASNFRLTRS